MKQNSLWVLPLLVLSFILTACPYDSSVPIDEKPSVTVPSNLIGKWEARNSQDYIYTVKKVDDYTIQIDKDAVKKPGAAKEEGDHEVFKGYLSKVDDVMFLNLWPVDDEQPSKTYYLYKVDITDASVILTAVTENVDEKFDASKDLKDFIKQNMKSSFFYDKGEEEYIKSRKK